MNCQGYAFWTHFTPWYWYNAGDDYNWGHAGSSNNVLYGYNNGVKNARGVKTTLEDDYLNPNFTDRWTQVFSSCGATDIYLLPNQWLIAFRVGWQDEKYDYHFWYRTDTGQWTNKHGENSASQPLGTDLPTDNNSIGWQKSDSTQFYDSDIIYYIITDN